MLELEALQAPNQPNYQGSVSTSTTSRLTSGTFDDIVPLIYSTGGSYNSRCLFGLRKLLMAGSNVGIQDRSLIFDPTYPISNVQNDVPNDVTSNP